MLNEKQTRFAHAYIACGANGRAAAIQAGYSHTSAAKRACDLLKVRGGGVVSCLAIDALQAVIDPKMIFAEDWRELAAG